MTVHPPKRRTNVSIEGALLDEARELGLNVSAVAEAALGAAVREARARAWAAEAAPAIARRAAWVEAHGLPLARWQLWRPSEEQDGA
jgi:antitoxin CcdA